MAAAWANTVQVPWALPLLSATEAADSDLRQRPERCCTTLASHEARRRLHRATRLPPSGSGDVSRVLEHKRSRPGEEHLLYVLLYRDKVAQHARRTEEKEKAKPQSARRSTVSTENSVVAVAVEQLVVETANGVESPRSADASFEPPTAAQLASDAESRRAAAPASAKAPWLAKAHVASVSAPANGGIAAEYLEAKRLGILYDQWREAREEDAWRSTSPSAHRAPQDDRASVCAPTSNLATFSTGRNKYGRTKTISLSLKGSTERAAPKCFGRSKTGILSPGAAKDLPSASGATASDGSADASCPQRPRPTRMKSGIVKESAEEVPSPVPVPTSTRSVADTFRDETRQRESRDEARLRDRVFHAVTNPKVTRDMFNERGAAEAERRLDAVTHIEGFPTLHLMRLHNAIRR